MDKGRRQGAAAQTADGGEKHVAAVEHRQGQEVEDGEVHVDQDGEPQDVADVGLRRDMEDAGDADGSAEFGDADIAVAVEQAPEGARGHAGGVGNLFPRCRVDKHELGVEAEAELGGARGVGAGRNREGHGGAGAFDHQRARRGGAGLEGGGVGGEAGDGEVVDAAHEVAGLDACLGAEGIGGDLGDLQLLVGRDAEHAHLFVAGEDGLGGEDEGFGVAPDGQQGLGAAVGGAAVAGEEDLAHLVPGGDGMAVDRGDGVTRAQAGLGGGAGHDAAVGQGEGGGDVADLGALGVGVGGEADQPEDGGEGEGEEDVHGRAGDEHQHAGGVVGRGQSGGVGGGLALDPAHVGELGQGDVGADRDPAHAVFHAVLAAPFEDGRTEAEEGEALDLHAAFFRDPEVAELMHEDRATEEDGDHQDRPGAGGEEGEEVHGEGKGANGSNEAEWIEVRPRIARMGTDCRRNFLNPPVIRVLGGQTSCRSAKRRASASAARMAGRSLAGAAASDPRVASATRGMPRKGRRPARKAATATSLAAL